MADVRNLADRRPNCHDDHRSATADRGVRCLDVAGSFLFADLDVCTRGGADAAHVADCAEHRTVGSSHLCAPVAVLPHLSRWDSHVWQEADTAGDRKVGSLRLS